MKASRPFAFVLALLGACASPLSEPADAPLASSAGARANEDLVRADAKATAVLATLGSVLRGASPAAHYELAEPFPLRYVSPADLAAADEAISFDELVHDAVDRVYPVVDQGQVVASITLHETSGEWALAAIAEGTASGSPVATRADVRHTRTADQDAYALVYVTGMSDRFLAHHENAIPFLTSLNDHAPTPTPASRILANLSARARARTGR